MSEWIGVVNETAPKFLQGAADNTIRKRLLLAMLKKYGRIKFNENSMTCTWDIEFAEQPVESYGDAGQITFDRSDLLRQLTIDWRGYKATDMMTEKERMMNSGDVQIVDRYGRIMPSLTRAMTNKFGGELFIDGNAAGNGNRLHGLKSFTGAGTVASGDRIAQPSDTYAGRSTALAAEGGSWTATLSTKPNSTVATDWPDGNGDASYDFMSPKLVNTSSTGWGTGSTSWQDNCEKVLRQTTIWLTRTAGMEGRPTVYEVASDMYYGYCNHQEAKQRVLIPHKEADDLGFPDVLNQEGVMIQHDFDCPANTGYGLNVNQMELASLDKVLFGSRGPTYDIKSDAYLFMVGFFGNARYNPKYFAELYPYA